MREDVKFLHSVVPPSMTPARSPMTPAPSPMTPAPSPMTPARGVTTIHGPCGRHGGGSRLTATQGTIPQHVWYTEDKPVLLRIGKNDAYATLHTALASVARK